MSEADPENGFQNGTSPKIRAEWRVATAWLICCIGIGSATANPNVPIHCLRTPGEGLQPQTVVDSSGTVHLVYLKGDPKGCDVIYARREPGRTGFSEGIR